MFKFTFSGYLNFFTRFGIFFFWFLKITFNMSMCARVCAHLCVGFRDEVFILICRILFPIINIVVAVGAAVAA